MEITWLEMQLVYGSTQYPKYFQGHPIAETVVDEQTRKGNAQKKRKDSKCTQITHHMVTL